MCRLTPDPASDRGIDLGSAATEALSAILAVAPPVTEINSKSSEDSSEDSSEETSIASVPFTLRGLLSVEVAPASQPGTPSREGRAVAPSGEVGVVATPSMPAALAAPVTT